MNLRLQQFVREVESTLSTPEDEDHVLQRVGQAMRQLVGVDNWLASEMAIPHPLFYQQYLLYCDPRRRFSVVSFVWGPGQYTPIHDHTVWGVIGMLRGAEIAQDYRRTDKGMELDGPQKRLRAGEVTVVSPRVGDVHLVSNAHDDQVSISIHAYGTDIGQQRRHVFDPVTGVIKDFVSGYTNVPRAVVTRHR
jgi:predicted metal-dependent enzyme (double-stranded beta helix superfamily)